MSRPHIVSLAASLGLLLTAAVAFAAIDEAAYRKGYQAYGDNQCQEAIDQLSTFDRSAPGDSRHADVLKAINWCRGQLNVAAAHIVVRAEASVDGADPSGQPPKRLSKPVLPTPAQ